jgi:tetratricopeptide (TPR) repeat protein
MAKKRKGPKRSKKSSAGPSLTGSSLPFSPREMQKMMAQAMASLLGEEPSPEQDEAERLLDKASLARSPQQAERLAREALAADPALLEAYEFLADLAATPEEAIAQLEVGLKAGEKVLGKKMFKEGAGNFWLIHETRPYMRLRHALASELWHSGRRDEAIVHFQEMLQLNPNDNQGLRDILAGWYLEQGRLEDVERLLKQFHEDDSAWWTYSRALLTYCQEGASARAGKQLRQAEMANEFLARYLAGIEIISPEQPELYSPGDENEGMIFARYYLPAWRSTPGALGWLRKTLQLADSPKRGLPGPEILDSALRALPQSLDETWEVAMRQLDVEMEVEGETCRPWIFLALENGSRQLIRMDCSPDDVSDEEFLQQLVAAMTNPVTGDPRRPGKLLVNSSPLSKALYKKLKPLKIRCEYQPELEAVEDVLANRLDFIRQFAAGFPEAAGDIDIEALRELPQDFSEVWQLDSRQLPIWVGSGDDAMSPSILLIVDSQRDLVPSIDIQADPTQSLNPEKSLLKAMGFPAVGEPRRPAKVQVTTAETAGMLREALEDLQIELQVLPSLDAWDEAFAHLSRSMGGGGPMRPALAELPGATSRQIAGIFTAAADFYRSAPWRLVPGDSLLRFESPALTKTTWFACVMGQMGETFGMALYEDEEYVRTLLADQDPDPARAMRNCSSLVLMYGERLDAAPQDVAAIEQQHLPLAAPEAYPTLMRVKPGVAIGQPLLWEARLLEAAMRSIPAYLKQRKRARQTLTVPAFGEPVEVTLEFAS